MLGHCVKLSNFTLTGKQQDNTCVSPQYVALGRTGTISCTFQDNLVSLSWYDTADYQHNDPVVRIWRHSKTGVGYESGEYDIHPNGSLSINKVSFQHNHTFTVAYIPTEEEAPSVIKVRIIVTCKFVLYEDFASKNISV